MKWRSFFGTPPFVVVAAVVTVRAPPQPARSGARAAASSRRRTGTICPHARSGKRNARAPEPARSLVVASHTSFYYRPSMGSRRRYAAEQEPAPRRTVLQRSEEPGNGVLELQRSAGNRAVAERIEVARDSTVPMDTETKKGA